MKSLGFIRLLQINLFLLLAAGTASLVLGGAAGKEGVTLFCLGLLCLACAGMLWHKTKALEETKSWSLISIISICGIYIPLGMLLLTVRELVEFL